ncbi:MAG: exodeoxyribonuclease III, partial [Candidatus Marinimicrobia bacterium]|nr:exodeoxyribonuclease III [Candidatus Neomarinimicrobiota bacterium]
ETKMQPDQVTDEIGKISPYQSFFWSAEKKGYSSVATYTKKTPLRVENGFSEGWDDKEGRVIMTEYPEFMLFNIYFPNGQKDEIRLKYKMDFYEHCLKYFDSLREKGKKLIICGDYNTAHHPIDLARPKQNEKTSGFLPIERAWMDKLEEHGYIDTFRQIHPDKADMYSWWSYRANARTNNVGWRIDYFYISPDLKENLKDAFILADVLGSDHCPVGIDVEF